MAGAEAAAELSRSHVRPEQRPVSWEQGGRKAPPDLARVEELVADLAVEELVLGPRD